MPASMRSDAQAVGRKVGLAVGLERHRVGLLDAPLLGHRRLGHRREACRQFGRERQREQRLPGLRRLRAREGDVRAARSPSPRREHARRRRALGVSCSTSRAAASASRYSAAAVRRVERGRRWRRTRRAVAAPQSCKRDLAVAALEQQARLAPARGGALLVARQRGDLLRACRAGCRTAGSAAGRRRGSAWSALRCRPARRDRGPCSAPRRTRRRARAARAAAARRGGSRASGGSCRRTRSRSAAGWWRAGCSRRPGCGCRSPRRPGRAA